MKLGSHVATEAGVEPDTKTRKRTEGASTADRMKNGDRSLARVYDRSTSLTSFGMIAEPPASEKSIGDTLVDQGVEAPKPCLSRGDAHANSRRWLTARRHSLYSN